MQNGHFVRFHKRRMIPERLTAVVAAWNEEFPTAKVTPNGFINAAVDRYIRRYERKLKIRTKYLDR